MNPLQTLLQQTLLSTQHVSKAAIIRKRDGGIRARTPNFKITQEEFARIQAAFDSPTFGREHPLSLGGRNYQCIRVDDRAIYAKDGSTGIIIAMAKNSYVLSTYDVGMYPAVCAEATEKLAEYLREKGK
ncbi:hypothetical protein PTSG_04851 [Salpingoeca rosetta]|uniref:Profilin n=1 Tax=Salpingoeca rosetta (strain ATCC 50818 / BSB-021) TaxID=946362 RepID=F2U9W1_SALR5|nr:uncharacterized protein PTSG_04851 [Salpingoeca rosetta]EGD73138.1 hypothetical protein PTSG_04851 [Salpingoeca rosetta]|eukprot:XP_004994169.1 hypothetical protein PTSG_04851 [Salpingoeca rosetta]